MNKWKVPYWYEYVKKLINFQVNIHSLCSENFIPLPQLVNTKVLIDLLTYSH